MRRFLSTFLLLYLFYTSPVKAQALTLDQLFWLRDKSSLDDAEYLEIERGWRYEKDETPNDSIHSTFWFFQDVHKKRIAELVYIYNRNTSASISYSTPDRAIFNAIKAKIAAYHMQYVGQKNVKYAVWNYFRYPDGDYDVSLGVYSNTETASSNWYTVVVKPH